MRFRKHREIPSVSFAYNLKMAEGLFCILKVLILTVLAGTLVNGNAILVSDKGKSSPSHISTIKGSSVSLQWIYAYIGDGKHSGGVPTVTTKYIEQSIQINIASQGTVKTLAKRVGENGVLTLESPVTVPFHGRAEVISSNNTLVIHNLQFNDSRYQFSSSVNINLDAGGGQETHVFDLKPVVSLTVDGIPGFIKPPPSTVDIDENSKVQFTIIIDGNPKPSAHFRWSHLTSSSRVQSVQLYPFVYSSTYISNNIDGCYCGRVLETTIKNGIGSSSTKSTVVTVSLKLDQSYYLTAEQNSKSKCIVARWRKVQSGRCQVKYYVAFRNSLGTLLDTGIGYNIGKMKACSSKDYGVITDVELTISFKAISKFLTAKVSKPHSITNTAQTTLPFQHATAKPTVPPLPPEIPSAPINEDEDVSFQPASAKTPEKSTPRPKINPGVSNEGIAALVFLFGLIVIFAAYVFLRPRIQHCIRK